MLDFSILSKFKVKMRALKPFSNPFLTAIGSLLLFYFLSISFINCEFREDSSVGMELLEPEIPVDFLIFPDSLSSDTTYKKDIEMLNASRIILGKYREYKSHILLKFTNLSIIEDLDTLLEAKLIMYPSNIIGDMETINDTSNYFLTSIYTIKQSWSEQNIPFENISDISQMDYIASDTIFSAINDSISFRIPGDAVYRWYVENDTADILLTFDENQLEVNFIMEFYSRKTGKPPMLQVTYIDTSNNTLNKAIFPVANAFLIEENVTMIPDRIYVGGGVAFRGLMKFDISELSLPEGSVINYANLLMNVDKIESILPLENSIKYKRMEFTVSLVDSIGSNNIPSKISDLFTIKGTLAENRLEIDIKGLLQKILEDRNNLGFEIRMEYENSFIYRAVFYSSGDSVMDKLKPSLEIYYTLPPGGG